MYRNNVVLGCMLGMTLLFGNGAYARTPRVPAPVENINGKRHPNLAAAQRLCDQAFNKITAAQEANEWDLEGHARRAKELLDQASRELKDAARASNQEHRQHP